MQRLDTTGMYVEITGSGTLLICVQGETWETGVREALDRLQQFCAELTEAHVPHETLERRCRVPGESTFADGFETDTVKFKLEQLAGRDLQMAVMRDYRLPE